MRRRINMCLLALFALVQVVPAVAQAVTAVEQSDKPTLSGRVITREKEEIPYATVRLKGTSYGCSTNDYRVDSPVEDFETGRIDREQKQRVKRFNDTYHNEVLVGKVGFVDRSWADRLMVGLTYAHVYKEIQTGVRQEIVYGEKHRHGHSLMPSLEYVKRNLFTRGLRDGYLRG